jgi:hypothetical protein
MGAQVRKTTKRKTIYALVNPITHALVGASITSKPLLDKLRLAELSAIEAFRSGKATTTEWGVLAGMLNVCETFAKNGIGSEALASCEIMQKCLIESSERYKKTKKMGTNGLGLQAMRDVYEYADLQRSSVDRSTFEKIIKAATLASICKSKGVVQL